MATYVFIQNYSRLGLVGISNYAFKQIAEYATRDIEGVLLEKGDNTGGSWELSQPIAVRIKDNHQVDINVSINLIGKLNVAKTCLKIQESVANYLMLMSELIPVRINIRVVSIQTHEKAKKGK